MRPPRSVPTRSQEGVAIIAPPGRYTSLQRAAYQGDVKDVRQLLLHGAVADATNGFSGWTALHIAAGQGHVGVVETLMAGLADPQARDRDGRSPLDWAESRGRHEAAVAIRRRVCLAELGHAGMPQAVSLGASGRQFFQQGGETLLPWLSSLLGCPSQEGPEQMHSAEGAALTCNGIPEQVREPMRASGSGDVEQQKLCLQCGYQMDKLKQEVLCLNSSFEDLEASAVAHQEAYKEEYAQLWSEWVQASGLHGDVAVFACAPAEPHLSEFQGLHEQHDGFAEVADLRRKLAHACGTVQRMQGVGGDAWNVLLPAELSAQEAEMCMAEQAAAFAEETARLRSELIEAQESAAAVRAELVAERAELGMLRASGDAPRQEGSSAWEAAMESH